MQNCGQAASGKGSCHLAQPMTIKPGYRDDPGEHVLLWGVTSVTGEGGSGEGAGGGVT